MSERFGQAIAYAYHRLITVTYYLLGRVLLALIALGILYTPKVTLTE